MFTLTRKAPTTTIAIRKLIEHGINLKPHQRFAVKWASDKERNHAPYGGIIADEMGLGKTLEIIALMLGRPKSKTLIIVPANLISQWISEFKKFAPELNIISDNQIPPLESNYIMISSYIKACRTKAFYHIRWDRLVLDEAHIIRNGKKGKIHKCLKKIRSVHKWCLTGTPIQNNVGDLVALLKFIGFETVDLLEDAVRTHLLRRTKESVSIHLPAMAIEYIKLDTKENQQYDTVCGTYDRHHLTKLIRERQYAIMPTMAIDGLKRGYKDADDVSMLKLSSNIKLDTVIKNIVESQNNEKPIIFCQFKAEMAYIEDTLLAHNIVSGVINGSVDMHLRKPIIDNHENYHCLIIQLQAGSTGLNLQMFDTVYFTSPHWNPTHEQQAIARIHRIGQTKPVTIKKFIINNTIETRIVSIQELKIEIAENIYSGDI